MQRNVGDEADAAMPDLVADRQAPALRCGAGNLSAVCEAVAGGGRGQLARSPPLTACFAAGCNRAAACMPTLPSGRNAALRTARQGIRPVRVVSMPSPRGSAASRSTVSGLAKTQHLHGPASQKLDQARVGVLEADSPSAGR